jgi:hypothetical protein
MNVSVLGVLLVCGLAVFTSASAVVAYTIGARGRRRRGHLRLVVGTGGATRRSASSTLRPVSPRRGGRGEVVSWDPLPVTQWQRPREHDQGPSPAA